MGEGSLFLNGTSPTSQSGTALGEACGTGFLDRGSIPLVSTRNSEAAIFGSVEKSGMAAFSVLPEVAGWIRSARAADFEGMDSFYIDIFKYIG